MRLAGKIALVSGAGRGIGAAIARRFAAEGASVGVADIEGAHALATEIEEAGGRALSLTLDVTEEAQWAQAVQTLKTQVGPLNVLVNNAAVYRRLSIEDMDVEEWDRLMAVNVRGVMLGTKAAVPVMREAGGGSIVNMSSTASYRASYAPHYGASKGAVCQLTKSIAMLHASDNIRCNSIHPGFTATSMGFESLPEETRAKRIAAVPLGRMAEPEEIANAVLFLASDEASYCTGSELLVDGGGMAV